MYIYIYPCIYVCVCVCMYIYMHMHTCIYISPQLVHARLCNGAAVPCHGSYCEIILSLARTSCRLSFLPALLPLREPAALLLARSQTCFGLLCHHTASQRNAYKWCAAVGLEDDVARLVAIHAQDTSQLSELRVTILQCPGSLYIMPGSNLVCFRSFVNVQLSAGNARTISFLFLSPCSSRANYSRSGYRWCAIIRKPASAWLEGSRNGPRTSRQTHIHVVKIKEK